MYCFFCIGIWISISTNSTNISNFRKMHEECSIKFMRKHFHLIGHFLKNAQSSENMYEIFFGPLKNAQLSENACAYPRASILT